MNASKQNDFLGHMQTIRWLFVLSTLSCALASTWFELGFHEMALIGLSLTLASFNLVMRQGKPAQKLITFSLLVDGLFIFLVIALTGGVHNPFALLLLIQVLFAAQCLPVRWTWFFSLYVTFLYSSLFVIDHLKMASAHHHHHNSALDTHLVGMLISFAVLCFLITYFFAQTIGKLNQAELQAKEDEKLILLGAFAAQAAHQLGTPLSSINLLVDKYQKSPSPKIFELIKNELFRCKSLLQELADKTEQHKATSGGEYYINHYINQALELWSQRTGQVITWESEGDFSTPLVLDKTLQYALFNLLDNSLEAQATQIKVTLKSKEQCFVLLIQDNGPGFDESVLNASKRGLGLYLTESTIRKMNGEFQLMNNDIGALVQISIAKAQHG